MSDPDLQPPPPALPVLDYRASPYTGTPEQQAFARVCADSGKNFGVICVVLTLLSFVIVLVALLANAIWPPG